MSQKIRTSVDIDGSLTTNEFGVSTGHIRLDTTPTNTPTSEGTMSWNSVDGTTDIKLKGGNVTLQVGQEQVKRVVNKVGSDLLEGNYQVVRSRLVSEGGASGQRLAVVLAQADSDLHSATTIGVVTETIANNQEGFINTSGEVHEINTTGSLQGETWSDGDILYLSPTTAGKLTNIKPAAPQHLVVIGQVVYAHAVHGKIDVNIQNGYELDELHDVLISGVSGNDFLVYEGAPSYLWKNKSISTALGYTPANDSNVVHISGTETVTGFKTFYISSTYADSARFGGGSNNRYLYTYNDGYGVGLANNALFVGEGIYFNNVDHYIDFSTSSASRFIIDNTGVKSSIYYDGDNTGYYLNPASSSNLYNVTANQFIKSGGTSSQFLKADGSVDTNTYLTTSLAASTYVSLSGSYSNPSWITALAWSKITGAPAFITSYTETDTLASVTGRGASTSTLSYFTGGLGLDAGQLKFNQNGVRSWSVQASGGNLNFTSGDGSGYYNFTGGTSFSGNSSWFGGYGSGSGPGLAFENQTTFARMAFFGLDFYEWDSGHVMTMNGGYIQADNSFRAPIFYDSNNTGYYIDPASTSNLNNVAVNRLWAGSDAGVDGSISTNNWFRSVGATGWYNQTYAGGWYMSDSTYVRSYNDNIVITNSSFRSPIFYDINDTAYFIDLNSTGKSGKYAGFLETYASANKAILVGNWNGANYWGFGSNGAHTMQIDMVNADSSTFLGASDINLKLGTNTVWHTGNANRAGNSNLFYYQGFTLDANTMDSNSSGFTYALNAPFYGPIARFSTGGGYDLWLGGGYGGGGNGFFIRTRNGDAGVYNSWKRLWTDGDSTISATGDFRAPIFYDSDNTGYYLNPASTSRMVTANIDAVQSYYGMFNTQDVSVNSTYGVYWQPSASTDYGIYKAAGAWTQPLHINFYTGIRLRAHQSYGGTQFYNVSSGNTVMGVANGNDAVSVYTDMRAPIYYDYNDTTYYLDPSSSSTSMKTNGNIDIVARSASWAEGIRVRVPGTSVWGGIRFTRDRTGEDGNWAIGFTGLNATDDLTFYGTSNANGSSIRLNLTHGGTLTATGDIVAYSDRRVKENIFTIKNALDKVNKLRGVTYTRTDVEDKSEKIGVIAQEIQEILPQVVFEQAKGMLGVSYGNLAGLFIEAIKEQQTQIDELKQLVNQLINK